MYNEPQVLTNGATVTPMAMTVTTPPTGASYYDNIPAAVVNKAVLASYVYDDDFSEYILDNVHTNVLGEPIPYRRATTNGAVFQIYEPIISDGTVDPTVPVYMLFRGTANLYDVLTDIELAFDESHRVFSAYENRLTDVIYLLKDYMVANPTQSVELIGHSLGARLILDVWYLLSEQVWGPRHRITGYTMFNPYIWADTRWNSMLSGVLVGTLDPSLLSSHIIDGDYSSVIMKARPVGAVYVYAPISPDVNTWVQTLVNVARGSYLNYSNHSIAAFCNNQSVTVLPTLSDYLNGPSSTFDYGHDLTVGAEFTMATTEQQPMIGYALNNPVSLYIKQQPSVVPIGQLASTLYLDSIEVNSTNYGQYIWTVDDLDDPVYRNKSVIRQLDNEWYISTVMKVFTTNDQNTQTVYLQLGLVDTGGVVHKTGGVNIDYTVFQIIDDYSVGHSPSGLLSSNRQGVDFWSQAPLPFPMTRGFPFTTPDELATATFHVLPGDPNISHRRDLVFDDSWELKENDVDKQFVIQSSFIDLSFRYLMSQAHGTRPGLVYWGSNNQQLAGGGITWKVEYDPVISKYRLLNIGSNTYLNTNIQQRTRTWGVAGDVSTINDAYVSVNNPSIDIVHVTGDTYRIESGGGEYILTINHGHSGDPLESNFLDTWGTSDELLWINKENSDWQTNYIQPPYWFSWSNDFIIRERSSIDPGVSTLP